jgi:hypothetical protein
MPKKLRKLILISALCLTLGFVTNLFVPQQANADHACWVEHIPCQEVYDCCCGLKATCTTTEWECQQFCGIWW